MAQKKPDGGPAFAAGASDGVHTEWNEGMSLRDYFAGQAMLMIPHMGCGDELQPREIAHDAYRMADAMIAERGQ